MPDLPLIKAQNATFFPESPVVNRRLDALEERVSILEKSRTRKKLEMVAPMQPGVCGIDPTRDSATCPDAGVYRHQQKCRGTKCVLDNTEYYESYRAASKKKAEVQ